MRHRCFLLFLLISFSFGINSVLSAQMSRDELYKHFHLDSLSEMGVDTFFKYYSLHEKYLKPYDHGAFMPWGQVTYQEKFQVLNEVLKPRMTEEDFQVLDNYWQKKFAKMVIYSKDIGKRYGEYKACAKPSIDSLRSLYVPQFESYRGKIIEQLSSSKLMTFKKEFKKLNDLHTRLHKGNDISRVHTDPIDTLAYQNFIYPFELQLEFPASFDRYKKYDSDQFFEDIDDQGYFDLYTSFDDALAKAVGTKCYAFNPSKFNIVTSQRDSLFAKRNAIYYLLLNSSSEPDRVTYSKTDTIKTNGLTVSALDIENIVDISFYLEKGYEEFEIRSSEEEVKSFKRVDVFELLAIQLLQTKEEKEKAIRKINEDIKNGFITPWKHNDETVYFETNEDSKENIFLIIKDNEFIVLGSIGEKINKPKQWFDEFRKGIKF